MKKLALTILFVLYCLLSFAQKQGQQKLDSLAGLLPKMKNDSNKVLALNQLSMGYASKDPNLGLKYANDGLSISKGINYQKGEGRLLISIGFNHMIKGEDTLALKYYYQALNLCEKINFKNRELAASSNIAILYFNQEKYAKAREGFLKNIEGYKSLKDTLSVLKCLGNIGNTYMLEKNYSKALPYMNEALYYANILNDKKEIALILANRGNLLFYLKKYIEAIESVNKSLLIGKEINDAGRIVRALINLGDYYRKIVDFGINLSFHPLIPSDNTGKINLSIKYTIDGIELAEKNNLTHQLLELRENLSEAYKLQGNYKQALNNFEKYSDLKDSLFNSDNKETIKNLEDKRTIELKEKEIQINKLSLKAKERQKWYYLSGLALLLFIGGLIFYQSRTRKKLNTQLMVFNNELDQANKVKTRFFSILNHDLRSPVANLIHFLHLQREAPEMLSESDRQRLEAKTLNSTENLLQSMEDLLLWSKGQMESFKPTIKTVAVKNLFDDTEKHFSSVENVALKFENPQQINLTSDEDYLKTIIRNLTSNAIKALSETQNPIIVWKAWQENGLCYLSITDNGPGGTAEQFKALYDDKEVVGIKSGLGLHLIRDLANAISCKVSVETKAGGTTFLLAI